VLAGAGNEGPVYDALMAESIACLKTLEIAEQHGISQIMLETDSNQMVDAI
jgi:ribonuclease HI